MFKKLTVKSPGEETQSKDGGIVTRPENYKYDFDTASVEIAAEHMNRLMRQGYEITVSITASIPKE